MALPSKKMSKNEKPSWIKQHLRTSIGKSKNTKPLNKDKRRSWKKYRGQGKK